MLNRNQEEYQTLEWIIEKSEHGMFLVVADEKTQEEIAQIYGREKAAVYSDMYDLNKRRGHWVRLSAYAEALGVISRSNEKSGNMSDTAENKDTQG